MKRFMTDWMPDVVLLLFLIALIIMCAALGGCAHVAVPPAAPLTPAQQDAQTQAQLHATLLHLNYLALIFGALAVGAIVYGIVGLDKLVEHIGIIVGCAAGSLLALTYVGLIALPYMPWIVLGIGIIGLGGAGYEVYVKFFAKKTLTPPAK